MNRGISKGLKKFELSGKLYAIKDRHSTIMAKCFYEKKTDAIGDNDVKLNRIDIKTNIFLLIGIEAFINPHLREDIIGTLCFLHDGKLVHLIHNNRLLNNILSKENEDVAKIILEYYFENL